MISVVSVCPDKGNHMTSVVSMCPDKGNHMTSVVSICLFREVKSHDICFCALFILCIILSLWSVPSVVVPEFSSFVAEQNAL